MPDDYTQIVLLCEDTQQEVFVRHFLLEGGILKHRKRLRVMKSPQGRGAGEQFAKEVRALRSKKFQHVALVVMIDAATLDTKTRRQQLDDALTAASMQPRSDAEQIAIFIPKRNIETWIYFLMHPDETVNETDSYPRLDRESDCAPFARELARKRKEPLPDHAPESLHAGCPELARIDQ